MLMMDRVVKMTKRVVTSTKGMLKQNWISIRSVVLRMPLYWRSGYAGMPGPDAMWQLVGFYLGWLGGEGKAARWALAK